VDLNLVARELGEDLVAGCPVQPVSFPAVATINSEDLAADHPSLETHNGPCYLAMGRTQIVLFAYQPGAFCFAPGAALARCTLDEMAACEFWPGRTGPSRLFITTASGMACELAVALAHRGTAHRIATSIEEHLRSSAA
jgi:hypothetical protein